MIVRGARRRARRRRAFAQTVLTIHPFNHERLPSAAEESRLDSLDQRLRWDPAFAARVAHLAERAGLVRETHGLLSLTEAGRRRAPEAIVTS